MCNFQINNDKNIIQIPDITNKLSTNNTFPTTPQKEIPIIVAIFVNIFMFEKTLLIINLSVFSCIMVIFDVLNITITIPAKSIITIYISNVYDKPNPKTNIPNKKHDIAMNNNLLLEVILYITNPPIPLPINQIVSLIARYMLSLLNFVLTNTGVKNPGTDIKK